MARSSIFMTLAGVLAILLPQVASAANVDGVPVGAGKASRPLRNAASFCDKPPTPLPELSRSRSLLQKGQGVTTVQEHEEVLEPPDAVEPQLDEADSSGNGSANSSAASSSGNSSAAGSTGNSSADMSSGPGHHRTMHGCKCADSWSFNGTTYKGCAGPPEEDRTYSWCYIFQGEACREALPTAHFGVQWDFCFNKEDTSPYLSRHGCHCLPMAKLNNDTLQGCEKRESFGGQFGCLVWEDEASCPGAKKVEGSDILYDICAENATDALEAFDLAGDQECHCQPAWDYREGVYTGCSTTPGRENWCMVLEDDRLCPLVEVEDDSGMRWRYCSDPEAEMAGNATVNASNATVNASNATVNVSSATVNASNATVNASNATVNASNATVNVSNATVNASSTTVNASSAMANASNATVNASNATVNVSNATVNVSNATVNASNATVNVSNATVNASSAMANASNATVNASSAKAIAGNSTANVSNATANTTNATAIVGNATVNSSNITEKSAGNATENASNMSINATTVNTTTNDSDNVTSATYAANVSKAQEATSNETNTTTNTTLANRSSIAKVNDTAASNLSNLSNETSNVSNGSNQSDESDELGAENSGEAAPSGTSILGGTLMFLVAQCAVLTYILF